MLHVTAPPPHAAALLTPEALAFVSALVEQFGERREALLAARAVRQQQFNRGILPDFNPDTKAIREGDWKVAGIPADMQDRRVEITGPAEPKMIINALNSGAKVFMADLEDSLSPTWDAVLLGQQALYEAVRGTLAFASAEGKHYALNPSSTVLVVRPRGWHMPERHVTYNEKPIAGALLDFGLYCFHNLAERRARGTGLYLYLPKLENAQEAALWADIFDFSERYLNAPKGSIRATVLIEVLTAVFEMHEILYALKDYALGLNCGRWDYIFSTIKKLHAHKEFLLPERAQVTMDNAFLKAYAELLIQTCHRRGAFAMGGMSAFIPVKNDVAANDKAFAAVRADKEREARFGHDGTWVAHPGLIPLAMEVFDRLMPTPNQLHILREDVKVGQKELLTMHSGTISESGLRNNMNVAIQYTAHWLHGTGCVPIHNLMEDAATAEIARSQLWQWVHHGAATNEGISINAAYITQRAEEELKQIHASVGDAAFAALPYARAKEMILKLTLDANYTEFLTLPAYEQLG